MILILTENIKKKGYYISRAGTFQTHHTRFRHPRETERANPEPKRPGKGGNTTRRKTRRYTASITKGDNHKHRAAASYRRTQRHKRSYGQGREGPKRRKKLRGSGKRLPRKNYQSTRTRSQRVTTKHKPQHLSANKRRYLPNQGETT